MSHSLLLLSVVPSLQLVTTFAQAVSATFSTSFSAYLHYFLNGSDLFTSEPVFSYFFITFLLVSAVLFSEINTESSGLLCVTNSNGICTKKLLELAAKQPSTSATAEEKMEQIDLAYARVSSREQAENTHALEQQISRLEDAGAEIVLSDVEKGKKDDRINYQEVMRLIKEGRVRKLIITRLDRISRSIITLKKIAETLQKYNVNLVVLDQQIDLSTPQGKLILNVLGMLAEWEVDSLSNGSIPLLQKESNGKLSIEVGTS